MMSKASWAIQILLKYVRFKLTSVGRDCYILYIYLAVHSLLASWLEMAWHKEKIILREKFSKCSRRCAFQGGGSARAERQEAVLMHETARLHIHSGCA